MAEKVVALAMDIATTNGEEASRTAFQEVDKNLEEIRNYLHDGLRMKMLLASS